MIYILFSFFMFQIPRQPSLKVKDTLQPSANNIQIMKRQRKGKRLIPGCNDGINPNKILKLRKYSVQLTVNKNKISLLRKIYVSPTTAWKKKCDHLFLLGVPLTADLPAGKSNSVKFILPPSQSKISKTRVFSYIPPMLPKNSVPVAGYIGTKILLRPFNGNVTDQMMILEVKQTDLPLKIDNSSDNHKLTLPLSHLRQWIPADDLSVEIFVEFNEPWNFTGSTLPEDSVVGNRIGWNLKKVPETDLTVLYSDKEPEGGQGGNKEQKTEKSGKNVYIILFLLVVSGVLYAGYRLRNRKSGEKENKSEDEKS